MSALRVAAGVTLAVCAIPASMTLHEYLHAVNDWLRGSTEPVAVTYHKPWWLGGGFGGPPAETTVKHQEGLDDHLWIYPIQVAFILAALAGALALILSKPKGVPQ